MPDVFFGIEIIMNKELKEKQANHGNTAGFTLAELLVVLAIISLILGVAIPNLLGPSSLSETKLKGSARTMYAFMRGARQYALTHRVRTAVTFWTTNRQDSYFGGNSDVIESVALTRQITRDEQNAWALPKDLNPTDHSHNERPYVIVQDRSGEFTKLGDGEFCIYGEQFNSGTFTGHGLPEGLTEVEVYMRVSDDAPEQEQHEALLQDNGYPMSLAYVFSPSGIVKTTSQKNRIKLKVGRMPDAPFDERFWKLEGGGGTPTSNSVLLADGTYYSHDYTIELYVSTGRIKIIND